MGPPTRALDALRAASGADQVWLVGGTSAWGAPTPRLRRSALGDLDPTGALWAGGERLLLCGRELARYPQLVARGLRALRGVRYGPWQLLLEARDPAAAGRVADPGLAPFLEAQAREFAARAGAAAAQGPPDTGAAPRQRALVHDLRNELTRAALCVDRATIESGVRFDDLREALAHAAGRCDRFLREERPALRALALRPALEAASRRAAQLVPGRRLLVRVREEELAVVGESEVLERLLENVLLNALRATRAGDRVRLEGARDGDGVAVTCRDEGCGMSQAQLDELFRPGVSGSGGTGYGTASVVHCARELGASVLVESELAVGTCVTLRLAAPPERGRVLVVDSLAADGTGAGADAVVESCEEALRVLDLLEPSRVRIARGALGPKWSELAAALRARGIDWAADSVRDVADQSLRPQSEPRRNSRLSRAMFSTEMALGQAASH